MLLTAATAWTDLRERRIPNLIVLAGILAGFAGRTYSEGLDGALLSLQGIGLAFATHLPLYLLRATGAGDVKLMAAVGAIAGPMNWVYIFAFSAVAGGGAALALIALRGAAANSLRNVVHIGRELSHLRAPWKTEPAVDVGSSRSLSIPRGACVFAGAAAFLLLF